MLNALKLWKQATPFTDKNGCKGFVKEPKLQARKGSGTGQMGAAHSVVCVFGASAQSQQDTFWRGGHSMASRYRVRTATVTGTMCLRCGREGWQIPRESVSSSMSWCCMATTYRDPTFSKMQRPDACLSTLISYATKPPPHCTHFKGKSHGLDDCQLWKDALTASTTLFTTSSTSTLKTTGWRTMRELWLTVFRHLAKYTYM